MLAAWAANRTRSRRLSGLGMTLLAILSAAILPSCAPSTAPVASHTPEPVRTAARLGPTDPASPTGKSEDRATTATPAPAATLIPIPPVGASDWMRGPEDAVVTLIEYSDFQ